MSFAATHPPSASPDSGSSASLTPTAAHAYTSNTGFSDPSSSTSTSAAPASGQLFSHEESKFITDSLSSAESFDPFTIGAPGFKVPSLLPPNIASTHDHLASQAPAASAPSSAPLAFSTSSPGQQASDVYGNVAAAHRMNSFNLYGHRPTGTTPPVGAGNASSPSYFGHLHDSYAHPNHGSRHASFSGPSAAAAGYGKNKAWQMEQLSFLEAQASRGQPQQQPLLQQHFPYSTPHLQLMLQNEHHRRSSTSVIGRPVPYENILFETPQHILPQQQQQQQQQQQHMEQQLQQQQHRPPLYPGVEEHQAGLAMLGAQFPSSHNFGTMQQGGDASAQPQHLHHQEGPPAGGAGGGSLPGGFSAQALAMLNGDAGLGAASSIVGADANAAGGNSTPRGRRASRTPTAGAEAGAGKAGRVAAAAWAAGSSASPSGSAGGVGTKRTSSGAPKTAPTQGSSLNSGPSGAVIRALGDLANLDLDLDGAMRILPSNLHPYFTPARMEKRTQPHLEMLRQQHIDDGLIDASTGLEIKPEPTEESLKRDAEEAEREKKQHTLLTTEEKKANHIASEQKRRANIRKGYELLCDIVPSLREALEREATKKPRGDDDESASEDDDEAGGKSKSPKKKKAGTGGKKGEGDAGGGGVEIDGEKIDGRAGPRSEAVVLMKSLDHMGALVEQYKGLLGRRNRARLAVANKFGWNGLANQPVPDIDRLLAIKVQEWWASHVDGEEDDEEGDDEELRFGVRASSADQNGGLEDEGEDEDEEAQESKSKRKSPVKAGKKGGARKGKKSVEAGKADGADGMYD
ncbi:hypothetical protein EX895_000310 [Sporisorium graminicola]|uniref:BHLH domain-containing protein n=1 Tax=Sporisorium graminicola TaxID=280036 RepID=A0A4U7L4E5_9BASI|nr:hypothetical protein EX895_000310 [Sporisorium graminicola]TKY90312.1 hypothetical protein EX895_000310 [Sporisorium graminicola]